MIIDNGECLVEIRRPVHCYFKDVYNGQCSRFHRNNLPYSLWNLIRMSLSCSQVKLPSGQLVLGVPTWRLLVSQLFEVFDDLTLFVFVEHFVDSIVGEEVGVWCRWRRWTFHVFQQRIDAEVFVLGNHLQRNLFVDLLDNIDLVYALVDDALHDEVVGLLDIVLFDVFGDQFDKGLAVPEGTFPY